MTEDEKKLLVGVAKALLEMPGPPSYYVHQAFKRATFECEDAADPGWTEGHAELRQLIGSVETQG